MKTSTLERRFWEEVLVFLARFSMFFVFYGYRDEIKI